MFLFPLSFWLPGIAAAVSLWFAIQAGVLRRPVIPIAVFLLAAFLQAKGRTFSPAWATGLGVQAALAVYLQVKLRLDG